MSGRGGRHPPPAEAMPAAVASLQNDPNTDWMFNGDPGGVGKSIMIGEKSAEMTAADQGVRLANVVGG